MAASSLRVSFFRKASTSARIKSSHLTTLRKSEPSVVGRIVRSCSFSLATPTPRPSSRAPAPAPA
eukprot:CAMPEP_0184715868 /NCGR_PEP_ID=MMETSP0314-20130426/5742_1 /TAXON_ID=38298 /ORGANISM="Rhodella maculata, Strain CCMP 736" /LENGTH=64 /DNA_ID=CAMNT_0027179151 /DNA_START=129 /DNA_END=319 /DNA_ORIENTATION=-